MGSEMYLTVLGRLEFTDVPMIKNYGVKPFVFAEGVYYPPAGKNGREYCRGGLGFGVSIPLPVNDMLSL